MTRADWQSCGDPRPMLDFLRGRATDRQLRLFACVCCRSVWRFIPVGACRDVVDVCERYADDRATETELHSARAAAIRAADGAGPRCAAAWAAVAAADDSPSRAAQAAAREAREQLGTSPRAADDETRLQADFLRDIVAPFSVLRPESVQWLARDPVVREIAEGVYEGAPAEDMGGLAERLTHLGCPGGEILDHCRSAGPHVRGCWVIDLLLAGASGPVLPVAERIVAIRAALQHELGAKRYRRVLRNAVTQAPGPGRVARPAEWDTFVAEHPECDLSDAELPSILAVCPVHGYDLIDRRVTTTAEHPPLATDPVFLQARGTRFPFAFPEDVDDAASESDRSAWWCAECQREREEWLSDRVVTPVEESDPIPTPLHDTLGEATEPEPTAEPVPSSAETTLPLVLMLEDDPDRVRRFTSAMHRIDPAARLHTWADAHAMLREVGPLLAAARLICLDHDLDATSKNDPGDGSEVVRFLVSQPVIRPVVIHTSNSRRADWMAGEFELAGWPHRLVAPIGDDWIEADWYPLVRRLLRRTPSFAEPVNWDAVVGGAVGRTGASSTLGNRPYTGSFSPISDGELARHLGLGALRVGAPVLGTAGRHILAWWVVSIESGTEPPWVVGAVHETRPGMLAVRGFVADCTGATVRELPTDHIPAALAQLNPFGLRVEGDHNRSAADGLGYAVRWGSERSAGGLRLSRAGAAWLVDFERVLFRFIREVTGSDTLFDRHVRSWTECLPWIDAESRG